jgi:hypothetical protein
VLIPLSLTATTPGRETRDQALAEREVRPEDGQVAVVDADDRGAVRRGAGDLVLRVHLEERLEPCCVGRAVEHPDLLVAESPDDDEDRARARFPGLEHLDRVHHEVLSQARDPAAGRAHERRHGYQVVERAAEVLRVRQDRERVGAR